jgi:hypothetical protein
VVFAGAAVDEAEESPAACTVDCAWPAGAKLIANSDANMPVATLEAHFEK